MSSVNFMDKLLDGVAVEWVALENVFDIFAGGDVPKAAFSDLETQKYNIPILSNGIGDKALYDNGTKAILDESPMQYLLLFRFSIEMISRRQESVAAGIQPVCRGKLRRGRRRERSIEDWN